MSRAWRRVIIVAGALVLWLAGRGCFEVAKQIVESERHPVPVPASTAETTRVVVTWVETYRLFYANGTAVRIEYGGTVPLSRTPPLIAESIKADQQRRGAGRGEVAVKQNRHPGIKVIRPHYYLSADGRHDVLDFVLEQGLGFAEGNVVKYIVRAGKKHRDPLPDLLKAQEYLRRLIEFKEAQDQPGQPAQE